jgi:hypothetical protein
VPGDIADLIEHARIRNTLLLQALHETLSRAR